MSANPSGASSSRCTAWIIAATALIATSAVVVIVVVIFRRRSGEGFSPQFQEPLHEGVEFTVIKQRGDWLRMELPNDKTGWIPADSAGLIES